MKNYKDKQINFCWTPFGYSYSVPLSLGYLKSNLTKHGYKNVKVFDLNQDFWYRNKDELGKGLDPFEERYQTILQDVTSWNNPENYYSKVHVIGQVKDLINEYTFLPDELIDIIDVNDVDNHAGKKSHERIGKNIYKFLKEGGDFDEICC